jgi:hypothetical protein
MDSVKYIGMDVHKETISIAVRNSSGKLARLPRTNHLSEKIHSKANCCWPGAVHGSLRPHQTALTCSWTAGNAKSFRSITHGAHSTTCVAGEEPERIYTRDPPKRVWRAFAA